MTVFGTDRVPVGWIKKRFRYLADIQKGRLPSQSDSSGDMLPYLSMEYLRGDDSEPTFVSADEGLLLADDGDVLLLWDGSNAGEFLPARKGVVSSTVARITPKGINKRFLYWTCKGHEYLVRAETVGMGIPHVSGDFLANLVLFVPSDSDQPSIADYLDRETARIDGLVAAKERVLALMTEKRRTLITHAVTRGINPKVSFRDSGIPWLGQIPKHWQVWKLVHLADIGNGSTPSRENVDYWSEGSIPWLNSSVVNQDEVTESDQFVTEVALRECHLPMVQPGSVLVGITGQGKTRGQAVVLSCEATINQHLAFAAPDATKIDVWFLRWVFFAAHDYLRAISDDAGGTKGALTCEELANMRVVVPPLDEQRAIVAHIAVEAGKLDALRIATERTIALLKERRAALIAAAVTGKIVI